VDPAVNWNRQRTSLGCGTLVYIDDHKTVTIRDRLGERLKEGAAP
jgi:hypothetical protein